MIRLSVDVECDTAAEATRLLSLLRDAQLQARTQSQDQSLPNRPARLLRAVGDNE